jgi:hypothetical protein
MLPTTLPVRLPFTLPVRLPESVVNVPPTALMVEVAMLDIFVRFVLEMVSDVIVPELLIVAELMTPELEIVVEESVPTFEMLNPAISTSLIASCVDHAKGVESSVV